VFAPRLQPEAELKKALRAAFPDDDDAALHAQVLQEVLARLDNTYPAFFRRVAAREKAGCPRFQGRTRRHSFPGPASGKEYGTGARLENGARVLSTSGRIAVRWSRPVPWWAASRRSR